MTVQQTKNAMVVAFFKHEIPHDETAYRALVELAEEMQATDGYATHHHPDLAGYLARVRGGEAES
jgi:hypothetical protein